MPPALPTDAAARTEPMPSTMVQKMTGGMIILMRLTYMSPIGLRVAAASGAIRPKATPPMSATMTAAYIQWVRSRGGFFDFAICGPRLTGEAVAMTPPFCDTNHSSRVA